MTLNQLPVMNCDPNQTSLHTTYTPHRVQYKAACVSFMASYTVQYGIPVCACVSTVTVFLGSHWTKIRDIDTDTVKDGVIPNIRNVTIHGPN